MKALHKAALIGVVLALYSTAASAQLTNQGMLDQVVTEFATRATSWQTVVMNAAMFLFWTLGTISLVFTFGFMALRKADIGEFFAEFIRFILFFGFFLWLLRNGPVFANSIIQSLARIGEQASGVASVTPSGIVDIGFMILKQAFTNSSIWSPVDSFIGVALSVGILILLAVVAVNMLLLLVSGWLLMYAGIFFLGFGGSRWTSDMALNYYKTVLGVAVQIMTMVLLVGIGNDLLSSFYARMNTGTLNFEELGVMLVFCVALLMLVNRVPPLVAGIITGSGIGGGGWHRQLRRGCCHRCRYGRGEHGRRCGKRGRRGRDGWCSLGRRRYVGGQSSVRESGIERRRRVGRDAHARRRLRLRQRCRLVCASCWLWWRVKLRCRYHYTTCTGRRFRQQLGQRCQRIGWRQWTAVR